MRNQFNLMFLQYSEKQTDKVGFVKSNTTTEYRKTDRQLVAMCEKLAVLFIPMFKKEGQQMTKQKSNRVEAFARMLFCFMTIHPCSLFLYMRLRRITWPRG